MSTTTQILFNSPALHSLKRDQLVKLCKIHSLKASGKNKDLIERLQVHAKTLPPDDPLSIATRSENLAEDSEDEASNYSAQTHGSASTNVSRPGEQWEVVMDTIAEVDEETLRSNRGTSDRQVGEFGTTTSKGSVTSSLRAIANSLGLKRNTAKSNGITSSSSSLSSKEVGQSSSTLLTSESSGGPEQSPVEPVPGQSNLRGFPAPSDARLSLSQAPTTTTIRLVSNPAANPEFLLSPPRLQPFATSFDLVPGTPGGTGNSPVSVWPMSPGGAVRKSLYPSIPIEEFSDMVKEQTPQYEKSDMDIDVDVPGGLVVPSVREPTPAKAKAGTGRFNTGATPKSGERPSLGPADIFSPAPKPQNATARSRLGISRPELFVFGSPLPQNNTSNLEFRTAAQSVLDEMNKRLAEEGVDAIDAHVLGNRQATTEQPVEKQEGNDRARIGNMFEKIHQKEFDKMDSITSHYAAKRGTQSTAARPILSKKRKSSLVVKERAPGAPTARHRPNGSRVVSGTSVKMFSGDFGEEEDEDDEVADGRTSKRPRVECEDSDGPTQGEKPSSAPQPDPEEEARKQKEREAIRRRLEHNKAKRRSSMGRPSLGRAPPSKPARPGFFATAKSLVQNVWNRGAGSRASPNMPSKKPGQLKEEMRTLSKANDTKKAGAIAGSSSGAPLAGTQTKRIPSGGSSNSLQSNAPGRSTLSPPVIPGEEVCGTATSVDSSLAIAASVKSPSTIAGHGLSNRNGARSSSLARSSHSLGTKTKGGLTAVNANGDGDVSSVGVKLNSVGATALAIPQNQKQSMAATVTTIPSRTRTTSTLMAPTASSLAKMNSAHHHSRIPVSANVGWSHNENSNLAKAVGGYKQRLAMSPQPSGNGGGAAAATLESITNSPRSPAQNSARPTKIFSQPLLSPGSTLSAACPSVAMSLTAAATSIVGQAVVFRGKSMANTTTSKSSSNSPQKTKVTLPVGRRPRISRSKVIAKLASQRATSSGSGTTRTGGKVRSSTSAEAAGKTRQSYAGTRGGDAVLMSAKKKRVRQSEQARRSRAMASPNAGGSRMDVD